MLRVGTKTGTKEKTLDGKVGAFSCGGRCWTLSELRFYSRKWCLSFTPMSDFCEALIGIAGCEARMKPDSGNSAESVGAIPAMRDQKIAHGPCEQWNLKLLYRHYPADCHFEGVKCDPVWESNRDPLGDTLSDSSSAAAEMEMRNFRRSHR